MRWLNYQHLLYFKTIATEGGVAKAAQKLRLGQPTLSTQLRQLEDVLEVRLFERDKKRLVLTEAGRVALNYANEIFRLGDEFLEVLGGTQAVSRTLVRVGVIDTVAKHLTLRMIQKAKSLGDCTPAITEGNAEDLLVELRAHRLDLVLSNHQPATGGAAEGRVYAKRCARMPVVVCGGESFAKYRRNFPKSLEGAPFVMPSAHLRLRHEIDNYLKIRGIKVDVVAEVQDTSLQKLLGTHAMGLLPIARQAITELVEDHELKVMGELEDVYEELWLIAADRRIQNPIADRLIKDFTLSDL